MRKRWILLVASVILAALWWHSAEVGWRKPADASRGSEAGEHRAAGQGQKTESIAQRAKNEDSTTRSVDEQGIKDRYAGAETIEATTDEPNGQGLSRHARLIRNPGGKYPLLRVEEDWWRTPSGQNVLQRQTIMAGDHVMVQLHEGSNAAMLEKDLMQQGFSLQEATGVPRGYLVIAHSVTLDAVPAMLAVLSALPVVAVAEPDYVYTLDETRPDDLSYASLWGMEKIGMPLVWDATHGTGGVVVAIFDTGIDMSHPDLVSNLWINTAEVPGNGIDDDGNSYNDDVCGWDFYNRTNDPSDDYGHGTHVAGTIGAVGNNGIGVAGVAWNLRILPIKFFGFNSSGQLEGYASDAILGMYYVINHASKGVPIRVTNHSWGGSGNSQILCDAFEVAQQYGILHVAAAGNEGTLNNDQEPHYPSSFNLSNIIAVANTTSSDLISPSSHFGKNSVDLAAPGTGIWSTTPGGSYGTKTGTSMASPHVAGVAALLFDQFPEMTWQEARKLITEGATPVPALTALCRTGGRLSASGAFVRIPPQIIHEPLQNTATAYTDRVVRAEIRSGTAFLKSALLLWNTTGSTNTFTTNTLLQAGENLLEGTLPGQPKGTAVYYLIRAETTAGVVSVHPAGAPAVLHRFDVTHPVSLQVFGSPGDIGTVSPAYGDNSISWGRVVEATAPSVTEPVNGYRWRCDGWLGAGSVPGAGSTNRMLMNLQDPSYLVWYWEKQAALTMFSAPPGVLNDVIWADIEKTIRTAEAPASVMIGPVPYSFIGWAVDGARFPNDTACAVNPAAPLSSDTPQTAVARYIPTAQDEDGDGLPDWWELFNFNHLNFTGDDDPDGDGFGNSAEFADRSNPTMVSSIPEGPTILHDPLPSVVNTLAPWRIEATVTDRVAVAGAALRWQHNDGVWNEVQMTENGARWTAGIQPPAGPGDHIAYRLFAQDTQGNESLTPVYGFTVHYPTRSFAPAEAMLSVNAGGTATLSVQITNAGNADLAWETVSGFEETVSADTNGWSQGGPNSQWHISTNRFHSASYGWFCGSDAGMAYHDLMDASLYTPPVTLGAESQMSFWHWAEMEKNGTLYYENYYWDGAVVEISRDGGAHFSPLVPVNGYPYRITPNPDSPFEANRPCLGGTTGGWQKVEFDLTDYAGETVQVRFRFGTDRYEESGGWWIDDVAFTWQTPWLMAPSSGSVPGGESAVVELTLDALSLSPGTYRGAWTTTCNAPGGTSMAIPVTLRVLMPPPEASMRLNSVDESSFVLTWASQTGRIYHLSAGTNLTHAATWSGIPGFTNMAGRAGSMSYTGTLETTPARFFRIQEQIP